MYYIPKQGKLSRRKLHRTFFSPWQTAVFCLANPIVFCYTIGNPFGLRLSLNFPLCERNFSMKNITECNDTIRNINGGSLSALIIAGLAIAAPFADTAWNIGQSLGTAIGKRIFR